MDINSDIIKKMQSMQDIKYKEFNDKIVNDNALPSIGVRLPLLKKYAKQLSLQYDLDYLILNISQDYLEQYLLKSILIGLNKKLDFSALKKYIFNFVPSISNWAVCDNFCSSLKITKKYLKEIFQIILYFLQSGKEFEVRFALVMLLNYYINEEYLEQILEIIKNVKLDFYYVKMANAWLISYCLIKNFTKTYNFLQTTDIDLFTHNKAIQKAIESFRILGEQKELLKKIKK
ncbi:MAG: DNA alkylation repair protein [Clostridiales bacterium]|nr:DNA alkylation repair protein [Clostridiales bacterium]